MRIVGPKAFTVGVATATVDPAASGGNPSVACQIQNSSSYQLLVNAGGAQLSIQPFWAQTVEISGQPITILPEAGTGSGTAEITLAFLLGTPANTGTQLSDGTWIESPPQDDGALTAAAIEASNPGPTVAFGPQNVASGAGTTIALLPTTRTVVIKTYDTAGGATDVDFIEVEGAVTGILYADGSTSGVPYLGDGSASEPALYVVSIPAAIETSITITVTTSDGSPANLEVLQDTLSYQQSIFYIGSAQVIERNSAGLLLNGPARILGLALAAGAGDSFLSFTGNPILYAPAGLAEQITLPDNTILPARQNISLAAGPVNMATVIYAYP